MHGELEFRELDVTSESGWRAAVASVDNRHGHIDILVNCAGIMHPAPIEEIELDDFMQHVMVNQVGVFLGMKIVAPVMRRTGGAIVNLSSLSGLRASQHNASYVATKFAVTGLTKAAARDLGPTIRVNSVHPGPVDTQLLHGREPDTSVFPIPRIGQPGEIAELVLWLASDASSYCTGGSFVADGGMSA